MSLSRDPKGDFAFGHKQSSVLTVYSYVERGVCQALTLFIQQLIPVMTEGTFHGL